VVFKHFLGSNIQVYLKNGNIVEGLLMEQTNEYIKADIMGVSIVYYLEEIEKIEPFLGKQE